MPAGMPRLPDEAALSEEFVSVRGQKLRLRLWGDRSKPIVLLQHGARDQGRSWDWTVTELMDSYCLAVPDLRGHGDSDWAAGGGYDTLDMVGDMAFIVEHLARLGHEMPIRIVGHSFGGNIALNYGAAKPDRVRSIVAIEGLGYSQAFYDELMKKSAAERMQDALAYRLKAFARTPRFFETEEEGIARLAKLHDRLHPDQAAHLGRHGLRRTEGRYRWKHDPLLGGTPPRPMAPAEYGPLFASIEAPVLLMYGKESWARSPAEDGRIEPFRNAELAEFDDAGHWLHHDRFEDFIGTLRRFLEAH